MSLLAYCIVAAPGRGSALPDGVRLVRAGGLAVAVSEVERAPRVEAEQVLAFESVVEWFHDRYAAAAPVRFGCVFSSEAAIVKLLRRRAAEYRRMLAGLEGAVEIGIRVPRPAAPAAAASGTAWLEQRRRHYTAGERLAARLDSEFAGLFRRRVRESAAGALAVIFLVSRERAPAFLERAARFAAADSAVQVSGPWPPYSFATGSALA